MRKSHLIDMHSLEVFLATARDCNMSRAAKRLGISQSAVSQTIRAMEDDLGAVLINRSARPLTLTPAGLALRNRGDVLFEEATRLRSVVVDASRWIKPDVNLGLVDSFAATCGARVVQRLLGDVAQLSVRTGLTPGLGEALVRRELDLVVSTDPLEDVDGIVGHCLLSEQFLVITPKTWRGRIASIADLAALSRQLPIVRFNAQSHLGLQIDRTLRRHRLNLPRRLEVDTADTMTAMVAGGVGWGVTTPLCLLQAARFSRAVAPVIVPALAASRRMYLVARKGEYEELVRRTFAVVREVLGSEIETGLRRFEVPLAPLVQLQTWKDDES